MATIVTRAGKGSPLTHVEVDANFTNLNTAKAELASPALTGNVTVASNSATAAVTITQIGAGNALVVEDSASPDATPFVVTAAGSVGIGTTAPATLLHLSSVDPVFITMIDQGNSAGRVGQSGTAMTFGVDGVNGATERMRIDNAGNVGIGTTTPTASLDVLTQVTGALGISVRGRSSDNTSDISLKSNDATTVYGQIQGRSTDLRVQTGTALPITFYTTAAERMRIDASGNVGIGTNAPATRLAVSGGALRIDAGDAIEDALVIGAGTSGTTGEIRSVKIFANSSTVKGIQLRAENAVQRIVSLNGGGLGQLAFGNSSDGGTTFNERMRIDSSGNVGIGTITPASKLDVNGIIRDAAGDIRDLVNNAKTAAYVLVVTDNGELINITTGGVTVNASIFSAGQNVTIYNNSASPQTITQGTSVTLRLAGTALTGNRTLAQRGIATILCVGANEFACSGAGLS